MNTVLQDCPFCGSSELLGPVDEQVEFNSWVAHITCQGCDVQLTLAYTEPSVEEAENLIVEKWNTRVGVPS